MKRELATFRICLESEIWRHLGFNLVERIEVSEEEIEFYLRFSIGEVAPADLTSFLEAVGRLVGIDSNGPERVVLVCDGQSGKGMIVIKAPKPDETAL